MSEKRFELFQKSIDDEFLEEAGAFRKSRRNVRLIATVAACFCAVLAGVMAWRPWDSESGGMTAQTVYYAESAAVPAEAPVPEAKDAVKTAGSGMRTESTTDTVMEEAEEEAADMEMSMDVTAFSASAMAPESAQDSGTVFAGLVNPMHEASLEELEKLGYAIILPEEADITWSGMIDAEDTKLAQVVFNLAGEEFTWRAQQSGEETDISGVYDTAAAENSWNTENLSVTLRKGNEGTVLLWYAEERAMQWCLWGRNAEPDDILALADELAQTEGFSVFAPIG